VSIVCDWAENLLTSCKPRSSNLGEKLWIMVWKMCCISGSICASACCIAVRNMLNINITQGAPESYSFLYQGCFCVIYSKVEDCKLCSKSYFLCVWILPVFITDRRHSSKVDITVSYVAEQSLPTNITIIV